MQWLPLANPPFADPTETQQPHGVRIRIPPDGHPIAQRVAAWRIFAQTSTPWLSRPLTVRELVARKVTMPLDLLPTILCVDDEPDNRRSMAIILQREGYRVLQAGDGRSALNS